MSKQISVSDYARMVGKTRQAIAWQCRNSKLPDGVKSAKVGSTWVITLNITK